MYLPNISSGNIDREITIGSYFAVLLKDISIPSPIKTFQGETVESNIQYHFLLIIYTLNSNQPFLCLSSEWNNYEPESVETPYFCAFTEEGHKNYGNSKKWKDIELFYQESILFLIEGLSLPKNIPVEYSKPNLFEEVIRTKNEIISEFGITEKVFNSKYSSYEYVLSKHSQNIGFWNDGIDEYSKEINALTTAEIQNAKYNLKQAIMNRVIVALKSEMKYSNQYPDKSWWKFWE